MINTLTNRLAIVNLNLLIVLNKTFGPRPDHNTAFHVFLIDVHIAGESKSLESKPEATGKASIWGRRSEEWTVTKNYDTKQGRSSKTAHQEALGKGDEDIV